MPIARSTSTTTKRKTIIIKGYQVPPKLPPNYYDVTSRQLLDATRSILADPTTKNPTNTSLQDSYNAVVTLCSHQFGPTLYQDLVLELRCAATLLLSTSHHHRDTHHVLDYVHAQYSLFVEYLWLVKDIYLVLDRQYVWDEQDCRATKRTNHHYHHYGLVEVGLAEFATRLGVLELDSILYDEWFQQLWQDWKDPSTTTSSTSLLGSTMIMWQELQWKLSIVKKLQHDLQTSLTCVSREWQEQQHYVPESFVSFVHAQWMHVSQYWGVFLPKQWLRTLIEVHLLEPHLNTNYLLKDLDLVNLDFFAKVWFLAGRLEGGLERVVTAVVAHGKALGLAYVREVNGTPKTIIGGLLHLQDHLSTLQKSVGGGGDIPVKQIWSEVLNVDPNVAEYLAKYIDITLRNHKATPPLDAILQLFSNLQAKDIFEAFYKKDLAKRLLNQKVQSMDVERQFVSLLKVECGAGYTSKMEGMFQDVEWSRETMQRWKDSADYVSHANVEMEVQILTTGYWPVYPQYEGLVLPETLVKPQQEFWNHYKTKYQGRKIVWQYALGGCQLRFKVGEKVYDLLVSLGQSLVLLCFDQRDKWKLTEICAEIGLSDREEVKRMLQSLSMGKEGTRVLRRITKSGPLIGNDDVFVINEKFSSQHRRIKINNILWKETKEDREKVVEDVSRDRLYLIDAVLVRIMKARKTILHQELIPQVLEQVKVPAQPADIKKRIESLIEREYMERDERDRNRYNYLA